MADQSIWKKEIHLRKRTGDPVQATPPPRFEEKKDSIWHRELTFRKSEKTMDEPVAEVAPAHEAAIQPVEPPVQAASRLRILPSLALQAVSSSPPSRPRRPTSRPYLSLPPRPTPVRPTPPSPAPSRMNCRSPCALRSLASRAHSALPLRCGRATRPSCQCIRRWLSQASRFRRPACRHGLRRVTPNQSTSPWLRPRLPSPRSKASSGAMPAHRGTAPSRSSRTRSSPRPSSTSKKPSSSLPRRARSRTTSSPVRPTRGLISSRGTFPKPGPASSSSPLCRSGSPSRRLPPQSHRRTVRPRR